MRESPGELRRKIREMYEDRRTLFNLAMGMVDSKSKTISADGFWRGRRWERADILDDMEQAFPWLKEKK